MHVTDMLKQIQQQTAMDSPTLAQHLGTSLVSLEHWFRGSTQPSPAQTQTIESLYHSLSATFGKAPVKPNQGLFASHGSTHDLPLFSLLQPEIVVAPSPYPPLLTRLMQGNELRTGDASLSDLLARHQQPAPVADAPPESGMSAGKNTYTYDAHTYHTKVPPQGIAELLSHYLPNGGLVLDPFAGSGMTGVAARVLGYDCILNELSPAACFIARQFNAQMDPALFQAGVATVLREMEALRETLYQTSCRECGKSTEILYTVWSYHVICPRCNEEFLLWDHCRQYGKRVKEHKILKEFPCPHCNRSLKKSTLQRTTAVPVMLGYKCCGSRQQERTHPLTEADLQRLQQAEAIELESRFVPDTRLSEGVNLRQPMKHGLDSVAKFYTRRNLVAMSHLWRTIHRIEDVEVASFLAFVFTSLYQRVTRLAEFRFWGGSGNTARFNVPYIFNELNVFVTFERKARSIRDHLQTTARTYSGDSVVVNGSATALDALPDNSIDLIFTDPPFGATINYSEMNILWESWLQTFTDSTHEAIINRVQGKDVDDYQELMRKSLSECYRVLRPDGCLLVMFMNSSKSIWAALQDAIRDAGFHINTIDIFDKQHGTFKQFVSDNTAGFDLVLHCRKVATPSTSEIEAFEDEKAAIEAFLTSRVNQLPIATYLHIEREDEINYRHLYSEWLAGILASGGQPLDFVTFRSLAQAHIDTKMEQA